MGSAVLFIFRSRFLVNYAGSGVNGMQVVLFGFSVRLLCFFHANLYVGTVVCISFAARVLVCVDVMMISYV